MERRSFFEKIVPGLKDFRDSRDLREGFGENPPKEVTEEIRKLNRRIMLKAAATTTIGALAVILGYRKLNHEDPMVEYLKQHPSAIAKILQGTIESSLEEDAKKIAKDSKTKNYLDINGDLKPYNPTEVEGSLKTFGFYPRASDKIDINFEKKKYKDKEDKINVRCSIDMKNLVLTPQSKGQDLKPISFSTNIAIPKDFIVKNKVDNILLSVPITYALDNETITTMFTRSYAVEWPEADSAKQIDTASSSVAEEINKIFLKRNPEEYKKVNSVIDKSGKQTSDNKHRGKVSIPAGFKEESANFHTARGIEIKGGLEVKFRVNTKNMKLSLKKGDSPVTDTYKFSDSIAFDYEFAQSLKADTYEVDIEFEFKIHGYEKTYSGIAQIQQKIEDYSAFLKK